MIASFFGCGKPKTPPVTPEHDESKTPVSSAETPQVATPSVKDEKTGPETNLPQTHEANAVPTITLETVSQIVPASLQETKEKIISLFHKAVETIVSTKNRVFNALPPIQIELTKTKLIQGILVATSGYFLLGAKAIFGGIFPKSFAAFLGASPLVAASGALLLWASSFIDYEGEKSLATLREQAKNQDILTLKNEHGLSRVMIHNLLSEDQFEKKCVAYMSTLGVKDLIRFYKDLTRSITRAKLSLETCSYVAPHPSRFKELFQNEVKNLSPSKIPDLYDLNELKEYGLMDAALVEQIFEIKKLSNEVIEEPPVLKAEIEKTGIEISIKSEEYEKSLRKKQLLEELQNLVLKRSITTEDEARFLSFAAKGTDSSFVELLRSIVANQRESQIGIQKKLDEAEKRLKLLVQPTR